EAPSWWALVLIVRAPTVERTSHRPQPGRVRMISAVARLAPPRGRARVGLVRPVSSGYCDGSGGESWLADRRHVGSICVVSRAPPGRRAAPAQRPDDALLDGDGLDLLHVGEAVERLENAVLHERRHPIALGRRHHLGHARLVGDQALHGVVGHQELVDAGAAAVAGVVAASAALAAEEHVVVTVLDAELRGLLLAAERVLQLGELVLVGVVLLLALGADPLDEAL